MKKLFTCIVLAILPLLVMAQTQKIAILETVDKEKSVTYAHRLMLRSSLAKAVTDAPGYEAYDRVDLSAILDEQKFQRDGLVSDSEIKQLGVMTGAQYVMIAEAVMVDSSNMFITAKIIDVETAQTMKTDNLLMPANAPAIQEGCREMAGKLLGIKLDSGVAKTSSAATSSNNTATTTKPAQSTPKVKTSVTWDWMEDCSVRVTKCYVNNERLCIEIKLTNNSGKDFKYSTNWVYVYDADGNRFEGNWNSISIRIGDKNSNYFVSYIPDGVTTTLLYTINYNPSSTPLSLCEIIIDHGDTMGMYHPYRIKIKNLPISQ